MSEFKLTSEIITLSLASIWDSAKLEWVLDEVYEADEPGRCLCGHYPIIETCILKNKINNNLATVGNCCVKKFIGLPSDKIFQAIKRVRKDEQKALNSEAIEYAFNKNWINDWEKNFYLNVMRKRNLTHNQLQKKIQINNKLVLNMKTKPS